MFNFSVKTRLILYTVALTMFSLFFIVDFHFGKTLDVIIDLAGIFVSVYLIKEIKVVQVDKSDE